MNIDEVVEEVMKNAEAPPQLPSIHISITLNQATGSLEVTGPLENKLVMFGLLEMAKDAVRSHGEQAAARSNASRIVPATSVRGYGG